METVSIDLNHLIVDMVTMLRRMIGEDIELTTSLGGGPVRRCAPIAVSSSRSS